ncbi:hypothetical protein BH23BAC1_BH23BAC1_23230 [soil metagenome]
MINRLKSEIIGIYQKITKSIWFIPVLISLFFLSLIIFLLIFHSPDEERKILQNIPFAGIHNADTARSLITTILAGTISLIIFSFTMMMFVLNQAASNYSSKVIGGMISQPSFQVVLGTYIGNIIYTIILLMQIKEGDNFKEIPHLAVFLGVLFFLICIILFVIFINKIYDSVQIYSVIKRLHKDTRKKLLKISTHDSLVNPEHEGMRWFDYVSQKSGYFQNIANDALMDIACKQDCIIRSVQPEAFYHIAGAPLFQTTKGISDKKILGNIEDGFIFYTGESIKDNPFYGIRQLSEVAIQALSTGINAPGTAIACLDFLGDLLSIRLTQDHTKYVRDKNNLIRIIIPEISLEELLEICISPIRIYGKKDINVMISLLNLFKRLSYNDQEFNNQELLTNHTLAIYEDGIHSLENTMDKNSLKATISEMQQMPSGYFKKLFFEPETENIFKEHKN